MIAIYLHSTYIVQKEPHRYWALDDAIIEWE